MMKLYYSPGACSLAPHIVLREAGIGFELVRVDLETGTTESGNDLSEIHPLGSVPVLELSTGERLLECAAILQYVAETAPQLEPRLVPTPMDRYRSNTWLSYCGTELVNNIGPLFNPALHHGTRTDLIKRLITRLDWVEVAKLNGHDFVLGPDFDVADAYLFAVLGMLGPAGLCLDDWPCLAAYSARVARRPAVLAALLAEGLV